MTDLVFVYGSLKRGFHNHGILEGSNARFRGNHKTEANYTMYSLGSFPGVVQGGETSIRGEVYEVDSLKSLDTLEGYPSFYTRIKIDTRWGPVWMYILLKEDRGRMLLQDRIITSGVW
jgi:gamma-glutamylcyclotransferase (GGCT)/AIG2-like uncharacterized protein YtfP